MTHSSPAPSLRAIRPKFLSGLTRICLSLGLGHFLCVPLLYLMAGSQVSDAIFQRYAMLLTASGLCLLVVPFLARFEALRNRLSYVCFGILFTQASLIVLNQQTLFHPTAMFFPLLVFVATPILGRYRSFAVAALSSLILASYFFLLPSKFGLVPMVHFPALCLLILILFFSAYLSETLWIELLTKEKNLKRALADADVKAAEMERWVQQLVQASSIISAGHEGPMTASEKLRAGCAEPLPYSVFMELTQSVEQMQERLKRYFSDLLLKDRLSSLSVLASGIAHELNTPLTTLGFMLDADQRLPADLKEKIEKELSVVAAIAKGLKTIAGKREDEVLELGEVIRSSELLLRYAKHDELKVHLDIDPGVRVRGSANEIQQIALNLFNNSIDALEGGKDPQIWIAVKRHANGSAVFSFRDNGCGMAQATLARALDPFFTTKLGRGTGLGLFVVHQIVKANQGAIEMESEEKRGTTVRIFFPLVQNEAEKKAA